MYETFEHTADLGLRIRAPDLNSLFADAGRALCSALVDDPESVRPVHEESLEIAADAIDYLLFDWLNELLYRYETRHVLFFDFDVKVEGTRLSARLRGETADPNRHLLSHEVKAITYHRLLVQQTPDGWEAEVIVDI